MQSTFRGVETFETACNLPSFRTARRQPALPPVVADLDAELNRFAKLGVEELRALWRERRGQEPPEALSKDLIARALAHWLQEERVGGLASHLRKFLASIPEAQSPCGA
jgi:hypothetical protein